MKIAIIGAGMTGLSCARALVEGGQSPVVFDKSRGLGGRLATRRAGDLRFDHGAQFVTARDNEFRTYLIAHARQWAPETAPSDWFVGVPGMSGLVKPLAEGLDIRLGEAVTPERTDGGWRIGDESFDRVISTVPVVQARALFPELIDTLADVKVAPCWTLMLALEQPTDWPEMARAKEDDLASIARNSAKPDRDDAPETWVVHASPDWSTAHLELDREVAEGHMLDLLRGLRGELPPILHSAAHRWRYAMTTRPLDQPFAVSQDQTLFAGGDWALGARVENAWQSGRAMGAAVVAST